MLESNVGKVRRWAAAMAMASMVVGSGAANAAVFTTDWDPVFSTDFNMDYPGANLGWKGSAKVTVPDGCLTPPNSVNSCAATLTEYSVTFYDPNPGSEIDTVAATGLTLPVSSVSVDGSGIVNGIDLVGRITFFSTALDSFYDDNFTAYLDFVIGSYKGPTLALDPCGDDCPYDSGTDPGDPLTFPVIRWTQVPEPASLALVSLALFAGGVARRHR